MDKYFIHGKLTATKGNAGKLAAILIEASRIVSRAEGCYLYLVSKNGADDQSIWVTEVWESKEAHDNSLNIDGVKELISQALPILGGQPEKGQELKVLGGFGL